MQPPSVDAIARSIADLGLPHPLAVDAARAAIAAGEPDAARSYGESLARRQLQSVINATGVLLHTNLGRAPLRPGEAAVRYANVELDLVSGERGSRQRPVGPLLARLLDTDDALVVNNGAAALLLALSALASGRRVVVSRGDLIEIGGGFRLPEILGASGAQLVEVGTTNRTRLSDFQRAVDGDVAAAVLKVHHSNFHMVGFTEEVTVAQLATVGSTVIVDIGSGLLDARVPWLDGPAPSWLAGEPAARQTLAQGADLVTFSGDKLLGGPQAGIVAGRAELVEACARLPLARALRPGGLVLGELERTLLAYLRNDGDAIPFWKMAGQSLEALRGRAAALVRAAGAGAVVDTEAAAGGGSVPGVAIPSAGVTVDGDWRRALRDNDPPIVARAERGRTIFDLRTVDPDDDGELAAALALTTERRDPADVRAT